MQLVAGFLIGIKMSLSRRITGFSRRHLVYLPGHHLEHLHKSLVPSSQPDPVLAPFSPLHQWLTFTPEHLSPEAPKRGKIFEFL